MGSFSAWHWIIVALVILVLFGRGKISETMGDFGRGIKSFKKEMTEEGAEAEAEPEPAAKVIEHKPTKSAAKPKTPRAAKAPKSS